MEQCPDCKTGLGPDDSFCPQCGAGTSAALQTVGALPTISNLETRRGTRSELPVLQAGAAFGERYTIEKLIGRGGMGLVYAAQDAMAKQTVALKLIRPEFLAGPGAVERLIAEGLTARDIRHPNVVSVYDVGEEDGQPFVSMEYLSGQSLREWHREKLDAREDIPLRVVARIIMSVLDGLKAAHDAGVIHRDLKPENIILTGTPTAHEAPLKILDFGIARATGAGQAATSSGASGTPKYMAPEQITHPDGVRPSADLYSLSILFYELLMDVLPLGHWQPPSGGRSDIPAGVDFLIEKGLSNRPANRPQTAAIYRQGLIDAVNLRPVSLHGDDVDPPDTQVHRERPGAPVNYVKWAGIGGAGLLGLMLVIVAGGAVTGGGEAPGFEPVFVEDEDDFTPRPEPVVPVRSTNTALTRFSGQWHDGLGAVYTIRVTRSGAVSGSGYDGTGIPLSFRGSIDEDGGTYTVSLPNGMSFPGNLDFDGGCHFAFTTFDPSGTNIVASGLMHVNHPPGAPCP